MSSSPSLPQVSTSSSPMSIAGPPLLLPSLSLSPISDLEGEDASGRLSRRSSVESNDSAEKRLETAARRASHNAVERQRRDKLNARILELASLLPNLAGVRRPSRIAITKSSIAYVHSARRHRILASQQLRALHAETEALRGEVNQWRHRAGVPGVLEPRRGDAFMLVLTGAELELDPIDAGDDDDFDEQYTNAGYSRPPTIYQRALSYPHYDVQSPFAYGVSPPSSSSGFPSPYSTPPSSATFNVPPGPYPTKFDMPLQEVRIVSPTPANPFEAQHFILKTEDEWATPPTHFQEQPHAW
ncbi:BHLH domain-containing protein [Mycena venus]|uniref:BHLH domain-containing protein n=1 Tax=Mycena venus TaxID=2733690 RepID=A0A8H6TZK1_9AGAR|nr:BHLH domain-containing protein [Mycena venus]